MLAATDYVGIATLIGAICAGVASILGVILANRNGKSVSEVHAAVTTPPNTATIGQLVADGLDGVNELVRKNGGGAPPPGQAPQSTAPH